MQVPACEATEAPQQQPSSAVVNAIPEPVTVRLHMFSYQYPRKTVSICIYATNVIIGQAGDSVVTHLLGGNESIASNEESVDCEGEDGNVILGCKVAEKGPEQPYDKDADFDDQDTDDMKEVVAPEVEDGDVDIDAADSYDTADSYDMEEAVGTEGATEEVGRAADLADATESDAHTEADADSAMDDIPTNFYEPEGNHHTKWVVRKQRLICTLERSKERHTATVFVDLTNTDVYEVAAVTYDGFDRPEDVWTYKQDRGRDYTKYRKARVNWILDDGFPSSSLQLQQGENRGGQAVQAAEDDGDSGGAGGVLLFTDEEASEDETSSVADMAREELGPGGFGGLNE